MGKDYEKDIDFRDPNDTHTKMIEMVGFGKRVVDFGCWTGFVARHLKERGCHVTGIEIDPRAAEAAKEVCDRVIVADLDEIDLPSALDGDTYDVGLFGDVLEHLKCPQRVLGQMRGLLAPGGYIVLSVPNITHASVRLMMLQGRFDYEDTGILDDTHLKYYTRKSIGDLLESRGYMVDVMDWTEQRVSESQLRGALDPLGLINLEEVLRSFGTWEAVAYQYVIKAFPASEEEQVRRLSEEKVQAERKAKELESRLRELEKALVECRRSQTELEKVREHTRSLEKLLDEKETHMKALEANIAEKELQQNAELTKAREHMRSLEDQIEEKSTYLKSLEETIREKERQIAELGGQVDAMKRRIEQLEA
jgi:SAM-dependent methyltransferase